MKERRETVKDLIGKGLSGRQSCEVVGIQRSTFMYQVEEERDEERIRERIMELARKNRRYGYRRITALLRREGKKINHKKVYRIYKEAGLNLPRKRPKRRRNGVLGQIPPKAEHKDHVWTYDFLFDRTENGMQLKILIILDEYTRESLLIRVARRMGSVQVTEELEELFKGRGIPKHIRSDNGGEFIANELKGWLARQGAKTIYIEPGHPWENGFVESFIGKFRDECLNEEIFWSEKHARIIVELWRKHYNQSRPHSSLGYKTPAEKALCSVGSSQVFVEQNTEGMV